MSSFGSVTATNQQLGFSLVCACGVAGSGTTTVTLLHDSDFQLRNVPSLHHLLARTASTETPCERPTKRCDVNEIMSKTKSAELYLIEVFAWTPQLCSIRAQFLYFYYSRPLKFGTFM